MSDMIVLQNAASTDKATTVRGGRTAILILKIGPITRLTTRRVSLPDPHRNRNNRIKTKVRTEGVDFSLVIVERPAVVNPKSTV